MPVYRGSGPGARIAIGWPLALGWPQKIALDVLCRSRLAGSVGEKLVGLHHLVPLPRRDRDVDGAAFRVDDGVEFGRKTSARTAEGIALDPPFPPDASWCARTTEPSTIEPTSSTSN